MAVTGLKPLALLASLLTAGTAYAATETVSFTGSTGLTYSDSSLDLQQFDSALGSLSFITIEWTSTFISNYIVDQVTPFSSGDVFGADNFISSNITMTSGPTYAGDPSLSSAGGTAFSVVVPVPYQQIVNDSKNVTQDLPNFSSFVGTGTVSYAFLGSAADNTTASNGLFRGIVDYTYQVDATITYSYENNNPFPPSPVPLPAALPLALAGLGLLGGLKIRRKS